MILYTFVWLLSSANPYEGWPRQNPTGSGNRMNQNLQRNPRRYSSPVGNGMRSPPDYWSPQMPASKPWQTSLEQVQFPDSGPPGLRQCSDPWQQSLASNMPKSSQISTVASGHGEAGTYVSGGGFGNRWKVNISLHYGRTAQKYW